MIWVRGSTSRAGLAWVVVGLACAALATHWSQTPIGAVLGALVLALSSAGYGLAFARVVSERVSVATAITTGLACLIVVGTLGVWLGLLSHGVQVAIVGLGIATLAIPHLRVTDGPKGWVLGFAIVAGVVLIGSKVADLTPWFTDGVNHTLEVKRLWDTGGIDSVSRQPGGLIVGQSLIALAGGVGTVGAFDAGLCAALLVLLLATELSTNKDDGALPLFLLLAVPIVLNPEPSSLPMARWCGILFHVGAIFALYRASRTHRFSWLIVPPVLGLVAFRWELAVLAVTYLLGSVWLTRTRDLPRWTLALVAVAWTVMFVFIRGHVIGAAIGVGVAGVAMIGAWVIVPLASTFPRKSAASVLVFAILAAALSSLVVPKLLRSESDVPTIWFGASVAMLALVDRSLLEGRAIPRLRIGTATVVLGWILSVYILGPSLLSQRRARVVTRVQYALADLQFTRINGYDTSSSDDAHALQELTQPGATIGFVGLSGSALDFTRNPIRDVSWSHARFAPPARARLGGLEYLLVEDVRLPEVRKRKRDPWGDVRIASMPYALELVGDRGRWRLYRLGANPS